ncbi:MAG: hypothetical protein A2562_01810 [Candidatus Nealsonbacteria bacterium RIFOXYD1_FULL_39_11]|jgi:hypothetical protein|nr:MAG: hypothetical protein A2562_01810 [Candidatus Nealsonbacteria bacterium RIFOXYD1_FULL_39_11]
MEQEKQKKKSGWSWGADEGELKKQVENYQNLKITESYRGISVLIISALLGLSLLLSFFGVYADPTTVFYGLIIYVPILFFVYKGHRWAIIALMILWTFEKGYQIYETGGDSGIMPIIWWLIVMPYFWKALKVENERRKLAPVLKDMPGSAFCHKCGETLELNSKFCSKCGAKVVSPPAE